MLPFKIVDCTLRDGGYYTNWDFPQPLVDAYFDAVRSLSIAYVEVGYRSPAKNAYFGRYFHLSLTFGRYFHLSLTTLRACRAALRPDQGLAIMFNYKDVTPALIDELTGDLPGVVDLVRFACPPDAIADCVELGRRIKARGIKVAINVMYMTKYAGDVSVLEPLAVAGDVVDYVALVDSYGGVLPEQAADTVSKAIALLPQPVGFHGHDNLSLAFANSIEALKAGATMLDSTFAGMGRGAGNLKTELITVHRWTCSRICSGSADGGQTLPIWCRAARCCRRPTSWTGSGRAVIRWIRLWRHCGSAATHLWTRPNIHRSRHRRLRRKAWVSRCF
jgi:4-hydroxy 2-oxovalerate aldolase